jgi:hypothetical protein
MGSTVHRIEAANLKARGFSGRFRLRYARLALDENSARREFLGRSAWPPAYLSSFNTARNCFMAGDRTLFFLWIAASGR